MEEHTLKIVEVIGLLTGITYVIGAILEKKWCWYFGIIATLSYAISTYYFKLYGEFALQFFYLGISFYGLKQWSKKDETEVNFDLKQEIQLEISYSKVLFLFKNLITGVIFSAIFYYILLYFNGTFPFWDALTSGFGIIATYLTTKKKIENWILWIIIDIILSYILYLKGMPFYSILYLVYTGFAFLGLYQWQIQTKD